MSINFAHDNFIGTNIIYPLQVFTIQIQRGHEEGPSGRVSDCGVYGDCSMGKDPDSRD